jgi:hypothetical protein
MRSSLHPMLRQLGWLVPGLLGLVAPAAWTTDAAPASGSAASGAGVSIESPPAQATPRRQRAVFVCQDSGVPVFSDRPCGPAAVARTLVVDLPRAGAPPTTVPTTTRSSTRPRPSPAADDAPGRAAESRCATLQRQLAELDDRMRTGYSAREAARLWNRWRELKEKLRTTRC